MAFPNCREQGVSYEKLATIGQGTSGEVFKARDRKTQRHVAVKEWSMENERDGFPYILIREIKNLKLLKNHDNVVTLIEVCRGEATGLNGYRTPYYLVFEFCEHDLAGLLSNANVKFNLGEIKQVMQQLLNGLD